MSFGQRRFDRVIVREAPLARFLPLDMGALAEYVLEGDLRRAIDDNARSPLPCVDDEERLALSALEIFAKKNTNHHPTKTALAKRTRDARKKD